ncbi:MAG TPA: PEP-CTERM sorting domain-containing protein [Candidatus Acidoferrales bacterium]|nr:PEP-CTERM sorting domain-containing protein [Candidatus Acidoferrales bacterium]
MPALAQSISQNQWYSAQFGASNTPVFGPPSATGYNAPTMGGGTQNSIAAPTGTVWTVNMTSAGFLTVTDLETSGDRFTVDVNSAPATSLTNTWLNPPGQQAVGDQTSVPVVNGAFSCGGTGAENIGGCLANGDYSSGTFALPAGVDTINMQFDGVIKFGNMAFTADAIPEPASMTLLGMGLLGLGALRRRRRTQE